MKTFFSLHPCVVGLAGLSLSAAAGWSVGPATIPAKIAALRAESRGGAYVAVPAAEAVIARGLFRRLLGAEPDAETEAAWSDLGYDLMTIGEGSRAYRVLREHPARREGRGFFVLLGRAGRPLLIQAPHADDDLGTGELALALLGRYPVAAAWSTLRRRQVDLAHHEPGLFNALVRAFADTYGQGTVLQLHGFAKEKRHTAAGRRFDFIASEGALRPQEGLGVYVRCLASALDVAGGSFPSDVEELGGTTNVQGRILRQLGRARFLHLEMSRELRRSLVRDPSAATNIEACLR